MKKIYEKPAIETILLEAMEDIMSVSDSFRGDSLGDPDGVLDKKRPFDEGTFWGK